MVQPAVPAAPAAPTAPETDRQAEESAEAAARRAPSWRCVVHDDPVNLMTYVTWVFQSYFGYPESRAHRLMLQVHHEGRAIVSTGSRESVEADAAAMHGYGLWATIEEGED
ncbi:ATP-dependent Clp protease adapter ClpS [Georgenia sp. Z1344]|uniref:ATP-dependent Clp protease adapter ClpS n=1 Tax=Georgenia sp. Z1344 TaxID=3416706 RepID=UPI003CE8055E